MTTLIKLFYASAVAALLILLVAFGIRTFYEGPEEPKLLKLGPRPAVAVALCPPLAPGREPTAEERAKLDACYREQEELSRRSYEEWEAQRRPYLEKRADYHRNVFAIAGLLGLMPVVAGVVMSSRLDAIRLGLVGGGLGLIIYAVAQAGSDLGKVGAGPIFIVAAIGLIAVLAAGYFWLGGRLQLPSKGEGGEPEP